MEFTINTYDECEKCEMPKNPYHDKQGCPEDYVEPEQDEGCDTVMESTLEEIDDIYKFIQAMDLTGGEQQMRDRALLTLDEVTNSIKRLQEEEDKTCHTCKKEYEVEDGRGGYEGHKCLECFEAEENTLIEPKDFIGLPMIEKN
tara:strand:- start:18 stop:449 length:432 start_codon:yes stop_codon:yes gene_type:complete